MKRKKKTETRTRTNLPRVLAILRESEGISLGEASRRCGLDRAHYTRIANGEISPSLDTLEKIANGFKIDVAKLLQE